MWTEFREVAAAFLDGALATVSTYGDTEAFYLAREHVPAAPTGAVTKKTVDMLEYAGCAVIADLGQGKYTIALLNYHRGVIKYDPELAQDWWRLQLAADAAHQARVNAYLAFMTAKGYPSGLEAMAATHDAGEAAVPPSVRADLEQLKVVVRERDRAILSLRRRGAAARGVNIGMDKSRAEGLARTVNAARERAVGPWCRRPTSSSAVRASCRRGKGEGGTPPPQLEPPLSS